MSRRSLFKLYSVLATVALATTSPILVAHAGRSDMAVRTRGTSAPVQIPGDAATIAGGNDGSITFQHHDGSSDYSVGVTNDAGTVGSQAVYLTRFTPDANLLPVTIDKVSFLFPTSDQFGDTLMRPNQSFEVLVYLDVNATGNPADAELVIRKPFNCQPSNTVFQTIGFDGVEVTSGSFLIGFTDVYTRNTGLPIYCAALDVTQNQGQSFAFHNFEPADHFDGSDLTSSDSGASVLPGNLMTTVSGLTGGNVRLCWDPTGGSDLAPPTNLRICTPPPGASADGADAAAVPGGGTLRGYKIYRSSTPGVTATPANFFASVPTTQTTVGSGVAPGGSFFVVTADYDNGESAPTNEVGLKPATIDTLKVTSKIKATGRDFATGLQIYVDGIPFVSPAKVKAGGTKVQQKGNLITGQSLSAYLGQHGGRARITLRNPDGTSVTRSHPQ
jgi:hypothetical protein